MIRRWWTLLGAVALTAASLVPVAAASGAGPAAAPAGKAKTARYVVVMSASPLVVIQGRSNLRTAAARAQAAQLVAGQDAALRSIGKRPTDRTYSYTRGLNGFATALTDAQVDQLGRRKDVARVLPDAMRHLTTDASPRFLGLSGKGGVWAQGYTGEDVVVGVIDSGIWPEHPSFADDGSYGPAPVSLEETAASGPACNFGNTAQNPLDLPFACNRKLIGARQMMATYRAVVGADPDEYDSARDDDGHGTHTASTAAGNAGVPAQIFGTPRGKISGIAPRARVIAYKGLGNLGGFTSDLAGAIDQAVADGVDVINYSVGGGPNLTSADDIAYLFAARAGVFVATSAGNDGPGAGTIGGPASVPWLTTVGASTQPRFFQGTVVLGSGKKFEGASVTRGTGTLRLVDGASAGSDVCVEDQLDPVKVKDAIVLCRRGVNGRAAKAFAVSKAGGAGMILYNNDDVDNLFTDNFLVPTVHLDNSPGLAVKRYLASSGRPTARIIANQKSVWPSAPSMAVFSSRGPDPVAEDIIKPDVTAPGVQILAGASPTPDPGGDAPGQLFMSIAGTSMSSPHVAGVFALIKQAHPDWTPAMAKSALMTTAYQQVRDNDRVSRATPFAIGSGHIDPAGQQGEGTPFDPGLVYNAGLAQYVGFLCDAEPAFVDAAFAPGTCDSLAARGIPTSAPNLNYPSIGIQAVAGSETVTRTVTRVAKPGSSSTRAVLFTAQVKAPPGFAVKVTPSRIRLAPGQSATFSVTVTNRTAPLGTWKFGSLTWQGQDYDVYSPIAVKGTALKTVAAVTGTGAVGSVDVPVTFGYTGSYTAGAHGLVSATVTADNVLQDPDQTFDPADGFSDAHPITVSGAALLRVSLPPDSVANADIDLDLYVLDPTGNLVGQSTAGGTDEQVDIANPVNGTYTAYVHGWATAGPAADYTLYDWVIPATPGGGNLSITAAPAAATSGTSGTVTASWAGVPATWNLGAVSHSGPDGLISLTLVEVDNRP